MLGRTLDTKLVAEMREATTGGEYAAWLDCISQVVVGLVPGQKVLELRGCTST